MNSIIKFCFSLIAIGTFTGCFTMKRIDESYTSITPGFKKNYSASKSQCIENVKKALKDLGSSAEELKGNRIISDRWEFLTMATASDTTAMRLSVAAKLYIDVKDIGKNQCEVQLSRIRAWENTSEYEKINVSQAISKIVDPFFRNLDERMIQ